MGLPVALTLPLLLLWHRPSAPSTTTGGAPLPDSVTPSSSAPLDASSISAPFVEGDGDAGASGGLGFRATADAVASGTGDVLLRSDDAGVGVAVSSSYEHLPSSSSPLPPTSPSAVDDQVSIRGEGRGNEGTGSHEDGADSARADAGASSSSIASTATAAIPNILHFTFAFNLLSPPTGRALTARERLLADNVLDIVRRHPGAEVKWWDDETCSAALAEHGDAELARGFEREKDGMYKGDVCRGEAPLTLRKKITTRHKIKPPKKHS